MSTARAVKLEHRPDTRVQEILEAALAIFAHRGYRNARLDDVAEAAGVTKGAIYHYFDTKEELLLGVIDHYQTLAFGRAEDALRDDRPPASTRIRLLVRKVFDPQGATKSNDLLSLLVRDIANEVPHVHEHWLRDGPARLWTLLERLVEEGTRRGEFRPDADAEVAARLLISGLMLQRMWQRHGDAVPELSLDYDRLIDSSIELFLASLRAQGVIKPTS
jgi:AcrR family transcriptional regulator